MIRRRNASVADARTGYDAFISYSHHADDDLAPNLRSALHRLAKPWYRTRAVRVFLDEAAMSAEPGLWPGIVRALDTSSTFLLLLSPEASQSVWVNREIRHWVERNGVSALLLVLTAGELVWDGDLNDFNREESTALPEALHGVFDSEPRYVDLRWADGRTDLTLRNPRFLDAVAELAAPLRGMSKDDLVGSDLNEHRRTLRITRAAVALLSALLIVSVLAGISARRNATRAEQRRIDAQAVRLRGESASTRLPTDLGFLLAAQAYRMRPTDDNRQAVVRALQRTPDLRRYIRAHGSRVVSVSVSDDGATVVSLDTEGQLISSDVATGETLATAKVERRGAGVSADADSVFVAGLAAVEQRDWRTLTVRNRWTTAPSVLAGACRCAMDAWSSQRSTVRLP